jgi:glucose-1-phosphate thymidylyltransferase
MVCHPLRKLVGAGITDILIVSGPEHMGGFIELLGSGKRFGCELTYRVQEEAGGIAEALGLAARFVGDDRVMVVLGDNIFEDPLGPVVVKAGYPDPEGDAVLVLKHVTMEQASRYGVAVFHGGKITAAIEKIVEKPQEPPSEYAVAGVYCYPPGALANINTLTRSARGELEITDLNNHYIEQRRVRHTFFDGYWSDAGTPESLYWANRLVMSRSPMF